MKLRISLALFLLVALATGSIAQQSSESTMAANATLRDYLPFDDKTSFENARRGQLATFPGDAITGPDGMTHYDFAAFEFLQDEAPPEANPSLWRQSQLNAIHGLFEVVPGIYQIRGFDLANMSFIRGETGWIVIDPLTTIETAAAGLKLLQDTVADLPVSALIITHSHVDHFGGAKGVLAEEDIASRNVPVIAPAGFFEESVSENLIAGNAMSRRATYMFGSLLKKEPKGSLGSGLGTTVSNGTVTILKPTIEITKTPTELTVDGIKMTFLNTPGAEAPAELMFFIHPFNAMMQAEEINHTFHNLYTLRGAKVRSGLLWSKYIHDTLERFGSKVEVSFGSHHWPTWGNEEIVAFWEGQRDLYRYVHDETLRLANKGETMLEIAEQIKLPDSLAKNFSNRDYYGSVSHNAKAQYQLYFGWFSGNPSELNELPPVEEGKKFVEYAGGAESVMKKAKRDFEAGNYRWVATALNHLVFAEPGNQDARDLLAETLTQLGYQAESGPWRNFYLTGASELRSGAPTMGGMTTGSADVMRALPLDSYLDYLAILLRHPDAAGSDLRLNFVMPDVDSNFTLGVKNGVMNYTLDKQDPNAPATVILDRAVLNDINLGKTTLKEAIAAKDVRIDGAQEELVNFLSLLERPEFWFNVVVP